MKANKSKKLILISFLILCFSALLYAGTTNLDSLELAGNLTVAGTVTFSGAVTNSSTTAFTGVATYSGNIEPGATGARLFDDYNLASRATPLLTDPSYVYGIYDEFINVDVNVLVDTVYSNALNSTPRTSMWVILIDSARSYGPNVVAQVIDSAGGYMTLSVGNADDDSVKLYNRREWVKCDTIGAKGTWFEIKLSLPDTTQFEFKIGLAEKNVDMTGTTASGIYFRNVDGSDKVTFVTNRAGSEDSVTAIADFAAGTQYTLAFYANGSGTVTGYVNGTALTAISKFIPRTANLTPVILLKSGAVHTTTTRQVAYVDYIKVVQVK
jgi:hypothetical protein